jgi:hypothetical protein
VAKPKAPGIPDAKYETGPRPPDRASGSQGSNSPLWAPDNDRERSVADWRAGDIDLSTLGTSGLKQFSGYVREEWSPWLQGLFAIKTWREMEDNSSAIGAIRFLIRILMSQVDWYLEPPKGMEDSREAREVADFVEENRNDMEHTWFEWLSEGLSFLTYGFAPFELVYKVRGGRDAFWFNERTQKEERDPTRFSKFDDNRIGWRKMEIRAQETLLRWEFDLYSRQLLGMHQWDPYAGRGAYIPVEKLINLRTEITRGSPEGRSLYRSAYVDYKTLKRIQEIEAIGIEHDLTGMLKMQVPVELLSSKPSPQNAALRAQIEKGLASLKRDERGYILVPPETTPKGDFTGFKLERMQSSGSHSVDTGAVKNYYRTNILQSALAQFLQLGQQNMAGSRALSSDHTDLFALGLYTMVDMMTHPINHKAIPELLEANGIDTALSPVLRHGDIESPPLDEISSFLVNLATAGVTFHSPELADQLMEMANLPKPRMTPEFLQDIADTQAAVDPKSAGAEGDAEAETEDTEKPKEDQKDLQEMAKSLFKIKKWRRRK